eukprot:SAG31_NODE_26696_length_438_cov_0.607670_2_plen_39_part_01
MAQQVKVGGNSYVASRKLILRTGPQLDTPTAGFLAAGSI